MSIDISEKSKELRILAHNMGHEQLTQKQREAYAKGKAKYYAAIGKLVGAPDENEKQNLYLDAFNILAEYIDEVVSENYLLLFATIVQELQDYNFKLSKAAVDKKIEVYLKFIKEYQSDSTDDELYEHLLDKMYPSLGFILLEGKELPKDENLAHFMFDITRSRGVVDSAEQMLQRFTIDDDGNWHFCGE